MKRLLIAAAVAVLGVTGAQAADMAARTYTKAPVMDPVPSWAGFYAGVDIGGVSQRDSGTSDFLQIGVNNFLSQSASNTSIIGGGHIGYNWQFARTWVLGLEADIMGLNAKNSLCRGTDIGANPNPTCLDLGRGFESFQSQTNWLSTVRGRLGYTFDRVMVYGTGGVAFGEVKTNLAINCLVGGCGVSAIPTALSGSTTSTQTGWAAGGGVEWMFAANWTARGEYLHIDLGNVSASLFNPVGTPYTISYSRNVTYDMGRVGVSYRFAGY